MVINIFFVFTWTNVDFRIIITVLRYNSCGQIQLLVSVNSALDISFITSLYVGLTLLSSLTLLYQYNGHTFYYFVYISTWLWLQSAGACIYYQLHFIVFKFVLEFNEITIFKVLQQRLCLKWICVKYTIVLKCGTIFCKSKQAQSAVIVNKKWFSGYLMKSGNWWVHVTCTIYFSKSTENPNDLYD